MQLATALCVFDLLILLAAKPLTCRKTPCMQRILLSLALLVSLQASADDAPWLAEAESLKPKVTEKLQALYPTDKGVGYAVGQVRGAMTLRKAL